MILWRSPEIFETGSGEFNSRNKKEATPHDFPLWSQKNAQSTYFIGNTQMPKTSWGSGGWSSEVFIWSYQQGKEEFIFV